MRNGFTLLVWSVPPSDASAPENAKLEGAGVQVGHIGGIWQVINFVRPAAAVQAMYVAVAVAGQAHHELYQSLRLFVVEPNSFSFLAICLPFSNQGRRGYCLLVPLLLVKHASVALNDYSFSQLYAIAVCLVSRRSV